jgi:hypothetical protein
MSEMALFDRVEMRHEDVAREKKDKTPVSDASGNLPRS